MKNKKNKKLLKINFPLGNNKEGDVISINVDKYGTPIERYWRDRVKDSKIDNCVEFLEEQKKEKDELPAKGKTTKSFEKK